MLDDDEDAFLILASQQIEEMSQQPRQGDTVNFNLNYDSFMNHFPGSSTQHIAVRQSEVRNDTKTGNTEHIHNNLFVDLTEVSPPKQASQLPRHLQTISNPAGNNFPSSSQDFRSSQKENGFQQFATIQANKIKALTIQLTKKDEANAKLHDQILEKAGETSNLRRDKKALEDQIKSLKLKNVHVRSDQDDQEKVKLRDEIRKLQDKLWFASNNANQPAVVTETVHEPKQVVSSSFIANLHVPSSVRCPEMSSMMFDTRDALPLKNESTNVARERASHEDVVTMQLKLAQAHASILAGGRISDEALEALFADASITILRINDYIAYLEQEDNDPIITFDSNTALTACIKISIPMLREKLTVCDEAQYKLCKEKGRLSVFQAGKLYPEELCEKPRRIIAAIATIAKYSRRFSEMLLSINVTDDHQSFVSILVDALETKVGESDNVYDYFGLAIASASLLESLGSHYGDYGDSYDDLLYRFLLSVLTCRCENAILMAHVSEFLVSVSKNPTRNGVIRRLCVNYQASEIDYSGEYKFCEYPLTACTFQIILMYLKNAFNLDDKLNHYELDLLLQITQNLNTITSNIQDMPIGTLKFLDRDESMPEVCGCFSTLLSAVLMLNHMALSYRNDAQMQIVPKKKSNSEPDDVAMNESKKLVKFQKSKKKIIKRFNYDAQLFIHRSRGYVWPRQKFHNHSERSFKADRRISRFSHRRYRACESIGADLFVDEARPLRRQPTEQNRLQDRLRYSWSLW